MKTIRVKVLSYRSTQQYAVQRNVRAALAAVQKDCPELTMTIEEVRDVQEILKYTQVFVYPSLVINEKLVCVGRFPKTEEVVVWFTDAVQPGENDG